MRNLAPKTLDRFWRRLAAVILLTGMTTACSQAEIEANFVPKAELWERWAAHDAASTETIDHAAWDRLLQTYLETDRSGLNRFDYGRVSAADGAALDGYIASLAAIPVSRYNRAEQFAYWVNLYNALTIQVVLSEYPTDSIRDINDGVLSPGPWDRKLIAVEGEPVTLNDIESRILRPIWQDPRIHYAVNCASVGCPNLQKAAFTGATNETTLEVAARQYINHPRGARLEDGDLVVSSIYIWFRGDFGDSEAAVLAHLKQYAEPPVADALEHADGIDAYEYDWDLNDESRR